MAKGKQGEAGAVRDLVTRLEHLAEGLARTSLHMERLLRSAAGPHDWATSTLPWIQINGYTISINGGPPQQGNYDPRNPLISIPVSAMKTTTVTITALFRKQSTMTFDGWLLDNTSGNDTEINASPGTSGNTVSMVLSLDTTKVSVGDNCTFQAAILSGTTPQTWQPVPVSIVQGP